MPCEAVSSRSGKRKKGRVYKSWSGKYNTGANSNRFNRLNFLRSCEFSPEVMQAFSNHLGMKITAANLQFLPDGRYIIETRSNFTKVFFKKILCCFD